MIKKFEGKLKADNKKFAVVISRFNDFITNKLMEGAEDCLVRHGCLNEDIHVYYVPGSFEIPLVAKKVALSKKYNAVICLGAIIRGATPHFDYISSEVSKGVANSAMETGVPVIFGVITADTIEQAIERAGTKAGNKGWDAALSAIEMADLYSVID